MKVEKVMNTDPVTVNMDDTLKTVKDIFELVNFHHLLVVENEVLVGIVSDRDFLKAINTTLGTPLETNKDLAALNKRVHQIMSRKVVAVKEDATIFDVVRTFNDKEVSCIPVVNEHNAPIGIVSWKDVLRLLQSNMEKRIFNEHNLNKMNNAN